MPTSADRFVLAFRHWLNRYAGALSSSVFSVGILVAEVLAFLGRDCRVRLIPVRFLLIMGQGTRNPWHG